MRTDHATLPPDLLAAVDKVVQGLARNTDELVESAIRRQLADLRRSPFDAEFQHMAGELDYRGSGAGKLRKSRCRSVSVRAAMGA